MAGDGFMFRFQKVLDLRDQQERALEIELAGIDEAVARCKDSLRRWQEARRALLDQLADARREGDWLEHANCTAYLRHVRRQVGRHHADLDALGLRRQAVRAELEGAMCSRKALENYRDKLNREFLHERERAEEKIIDLHSARTYIRTEEAM